MPRDPFPHDYIRNPISRKNFAWGRLACRLFAAFAPFHLALGEEPSWPAFHFDKPAVAEEWRFPHDARLNVTPEGLEFEISGPDPYVSGPARDYPKGQTGWLRISLRASQPGTGQVFWFRDGPREADSIRFVVADTNWNELQLPVPALGPGTHLRLDPPGDRGTCVVRSIVAAPREIFPEPAWIRPPEVSVSAPPMATVKSGSLEWRQVGNRWGEFLLLHSGRVIAQGNSRSLAGWMKDGHPDWIELNAPVQVESGDASLTVRYGPFSNRPGPIALEQRVSAKGTNELLEIETRLMAMTAVDLLSAPLCLVYPRAEVFGREPAQALFCGVEYLTGEPSSSERSLRGLQALRRIPDASKLTIPLMAVASTSQWVALDWEPTPRVAALFDVPDRIWHSDGPVFGWIAPGAPEADRPEGAVVPYQAIHLKEGETLLVRGTLAAGFGDSVVPAVQDWVRRRPLPPQPDIGLRRSGTNFLESSAHGWLDSPVRRGSLYAHAVGPNFAARPAADAALWMDWLAAQLPDVALKERLRAAAAAALAEVPAAQWHSAQIGHIRLPLLPLVYGHVAENLSAIEAEAWEWVRQLGPEGVLRYQPRAGHLDLAETHGASEANGLVALPIRTVLEAGLITGNRQLRQEGLRLLSTLDRWRRDIPRGAQSWEVPLHAPDILASAYLVDAYRLGHELTGNPDFLAAARYWAWTGMPFVYLGPGRSDRVGAYATIPVYGATEFVAPNWMGLPVQWCGLVYGESLRRMSEFDSSGPWRAISRGITASGMQQMHPKEDGALEGLLPDSFELKTQLRNPVPINPATLLPGMADLLGYSRLFSSRWIVKLGVGVDTPGELTNLREEPASLSFRVHGWSDRPWWLLVSGRDQCPSIQVNGQTQNLSTGDEWVSDKGWLLLRLQGSPSVQLTW